MIQNKNIFCPENAFETVIYKISTILFRLHFVKTPYHTKMSITPKVLKLLHANWTKFNCVFIYLWKFSFKKFHLISSTGKYWPPFLFRLRYVDGSRWVSMGLLPDTLNCRLRMRRKCREFFPRHRLQRKLLVNEPGIHHGTCAMHVPWCMSGSLTHGGGENVPGIPGACTIHNFTYLARGPWWGVHSCRLSSMPLLLSDF